MAVSNRNHIEKMIYDVFLALDPTGVNAEKYKSILSVLNEKDFEDFMKNFLKDDNEQFVLDIVEFERSLKMEHCEKAAKVIGVPLMEYVYLPHLTMDRQRVIVTKEKCLVTYTNVKRTQQLLHNKNSLSTGSDRRSADTGQVTGKDKNARDSDIEAAMLVALGAEHILREFHGPRADDPVMRQQLRQSINTKGYALLAEMDDDPRNKVTLNTINTYLIGMGLKSDLVSPTYVLPKTSREI